MIYLRDITKGYFHGYLFISSDGFWDIYIYINGYNCDITYSYAGFPGWGIFYQIVRIIKH
jgi:hypothetical protein